MTTSTELYRLLAWFSPSYPIGAFSYSHGVEYAVETGRVTNVATLTQWIAHILRHGAGWVDAVLLKEAHAAADDAAKLGDLADLASAWRGTAEMALESCQQGGSYLSVTRAAWGDSPALDAFAALRADRPVPLCIAVGVAAADHSLEIESVLAAYLHAFAANLVSAAVRLIPLGQTDGQRTLAALMPVVESIVPCALTCALDDCGTASPMIDLTSMMHETQYTRLFRS
ncbi:MAG: urease accessory protein UreF [Ferrovibrio sp.]|uniref:urease accessory protein UreF n=1 Tax=Ferrovibrio sp. TaxID=1917215 RepID=UPI0026098A42|nr:urease accessory protein UreF [Ferrovibrio sp.]MCW0234854.1 urease accessory protein UreF [Ferrovibrio sp.]